MVAQSALTIGLRWTPRLHSVSIPDVIAASLTMTHHASRPMPEELQIRTHGPDSLRTLVYLPGLHGDWTLVGHFRRALAGRVRFVEITYPRTLAWSLEDYAAGVEQALAEQGIFAGWLLGESFSSLVVWPMLARNRFQAHGVVLSGGFVRHPMRWGVRLAERICGWVSLDLLVRILFGYAKLARFRHRHSPETLSAIQEFISRRTALDLKAAQHRLHLVAQADFCPLAQQLTVPIFALSGLFDPIVPWLWTRPWLKKNCPGLREFKIIWRSDHNVLGNAPEIAAEQVVRWMTQSKAPSSKPEVGGRRPARPLTSAL